jgi:endo-1,4-beta-xylanase
MRLKSRCLALLLLLVPAWATADDPNPEVPLWPNGAPGFEKRKGEPDVQTVSKSGEVSVKGVHNPSLTVFLPAKGKANGTAVVIAPGGGHRNLAWTHEGVNEGKWLSEHGIATFVLKYRLAREPNSPYKIEEHALQDGQRAMRLVRSRASEWGVNANRVGLMGFSAGGEVTAMVCNNFDKGKEGADDAVDRQSCRPDFQALIYSGPLGIRGATIRKDMPPTFIAVGDTDNFAPMLTDHYKALRAAGVSADLHVYAKTGHGFGLRESNKGKPSNDWVQRFEEFLGVQGMLK